MSKTATTIGAMIVVLVGLGPLPARAADSRHPAELVGKWRVEMVDQGGKLRPLPRGMEMVLHFLDSGEFRVVGSRGDQSKRETGTWSVKGGTLITNIAKKSERIDYRVKGRSLTLMKKATRSRMVLQRLD